MGIYCGVVVGLCLMLFCLFIWLLYGLDECCLGWLLWLLYYCGLTLCFVDYVRRTLMLVMLCGLCLV